MTIPRRSLLFGYHQVLIHPLFVLRAMRRWPGMKGLICVWMHDWGYWRCNDMDGESIAHGGLWHSANSVYFIRRWFPSMDIYWCNQVLFHSRRFSLKWDAPMSLLGYFDKQAIYLTPRWLCWILMNLSGEIREYMIQDYQQGETSWDWIGRLQDRLRIEFPIKGEDDGNSVGSSTTDQESFWLGS